MSKQLSQFKEVRSFNSPIDLMNLNDDLRTLFNKLQGNVDGVDLEDGAIDYLQIKDGAIRTAQIGNAVIVDAHIDRLSAERIQIQDGDIDRLTANAVKIQDGDIDRLTANKLVVLNADIQDATIEYGKIKSVSASSISTGTLDTSKATIQGSNGKLVLANNTITITDASNKTRAKLGDVNGDGSFYGMGIYGADGTTALFNETGITTDGIPNGTITYDALNQYLKDNIGFVLGGAAVYYQTAAPTGGTYYEGDYWFDTDDSYKAYRYTSGAWVLQSTDQAAYKVGYMIAQFIAAGAVTADKITTGTMSADRISGGTLLIGTAGAARSEMYSSAGSPIHRYYNSSNVLRRSDTPEGIFFYDSLGAASVKLGTTTGDETITVGSGKDFATIQAAFDSLPMFINHIITIVIYSGTYAESVIIKDFQGSGEIIIAVATGESATIDRFYIESCNCELFINAAYDSPGTLTLTNAVYPTIDVFGCKHIQIGNITSTASGYCGVRISSSVANIHDSTYSNKDYGVWFGLSRVQMHGVSGSGNTIGKYVISSLLCETETNTITGTTPISSLGGTIIPSNGIQFDTDGTLAANSDAKVATQKAVKTYMDARQPVGVIEMYGGSSAPSGYLMCDGSAVSRTTYAALYNVIGTTYGAGDGSSTFNVPDLRGRVAVGKSADAEFDTLGETGGEKTHTLTSGESGVPAHTHPVGHSSSSTDGADYSGGDITATFGFAPSKVNQAGIYAFLAKNNTAANAANAHNNLQPYQVVNYIIKY